MVQQVAGIRPNLEIVALREVDLLGECRIDVPETGAAEIIASRIREFPRARCAELRPLVGGEGVDVTAGRIVEHLAQAVRTIAGGVGRSLPQAADSIRSVV